MMWLWQPRPGCPRLSKSVCWLVTLPSHPRLLITCEVMTLGEVCVCFTDGLNAKILSPSWEKRPLKCLAASCKQRLLQVLGNTLMTVPGVQANSATWGAPRLWGISQVAWEKGVGIRLWLKRTLTSHSIVTVDLKGLVPKNCACLLWSKFKLVIFYLIGKEVVKSEKKSWENFLLLLPYSCRFIF